MNVIIRLIEAFIPLIIELVKEHHPEKKCEEHNEIAKNLITRHFKK